MFCKDGGGTLSLCVGQSGISFTGLFLLPYIRFTHNDPVKISWLGPTKPNYSVLAKNFPGHKFTNDPEKIKDKLNCD